MNNTTMMYKMIWNSAIHESEFYGEDQEECELPKKKDMENYIAKHEYPSMDVRITLTGYDGWIHYASKYTINANNLEEAKQQAKEVYTKIEPKIDYYSLEDDKSNFLYKWVLS